jgi:hypothetical protein
MAAAIATIITKYIIPNLKRAEDEHFQMEIQSG